MTDPTDFDDGPPTRIDEAEVIDDDAEALAVDGPPDNKHELTPTKIAEDACGHCLLIETRRLPNGTPPPPDCDRAWGHTRCCAPWDGRWSWCHLRGVLVVDGVVTDCNRRKARGGPPPGTPERRQRR